VIDSIFAKEEAYQDCLMYGTLEVNTELSPSYIYVLAWWPHISLSVALRISGSCKLFMVVAWALPLC